MRKTEDFYKCKKIKCASCLYNPLFILRRTSLVRLSCWSGVAIPSWYLTINYGIKSISDFFLLLLLFRTALCGTTILLWCRVPQWYRLECVSSSVYSKSPRWEARFHPNFCRTSCRSSKKYLWDSSHPPIILVTKVAIPTVVEIAVSFLCWVTQFSCC